jgi:hypothetical protein
MEMNLQPLATACAVSGEPFVEGSRVASYLVRSGAAMEIVRYDVLEPHTTNFTPEGQVACRWVHAYKPRRSGENPDRALKLTAENLFVALADPTTEPTPENTRLVQFLALMLERKRILKPKGRSADGARNRFEHAKSKQIFEVPAGELTPEFFVAVQEQLSVLVGTPKPKSEAGAKPTEPSPSPAPVAEPARGASSGDDATPAEPAPNAQLDAGVADSAGAPSEPPVPERTDSTGSSGGGTAAA